MYNFYSAVVFPLFLTTFTSFCLPIYLWCCFNLDASGCFPFMESNSLLIRLKHLSDVTDAWSWRALINLQQRLSKCSETFHKAKKTWLISSNGKTTKLQASLCIYVHNLINMVTRLPPLHSMYLQKLLCVRVQLLNPARLTGLYSRDAIDITDSTKVLFLCLCLLVHYLQT